MGKLKCLLCAPFTCCVGGKAGYDKKIQDHRRTQLSGLDQAFRSINLGQNNYSPQIDEPNDEETKPRKTGLKLEIEDSCYQSAILEPYKSL